MQVAKRVFFSFLSLTLFCPKRLLALPAKFLSSSSLSVRKRENVGSIFTHNVTRRRRRLFSLPT